MRSRIEAWRAAFHPLPSLMLCVVVAQGLPHCTVALEPAAKADLPHLLTLPDALLGFYVGQHIPVQHPSLLSSGTVLKMPTGGNIRQSLGLEAWVQHCR